MRIVHGKTWVCHVEPSKPCTGALKYLKENGHPYSIVDNELVTEPDDWSVFLNGTSNN
jgi:hypothetical protein